MEITVRTCGDSCSEADRNAQFGGKRAKARLFCNTIVSEQTKILSNVRENLSRRGKGTEQEEQRNLRETKELEQEGQRNLRETKELERDKGT